MGGIGHGSYRYDLKRDAVPAPATAQTRGSGTDFNLGLAYDAYRSVVLGSGFTASASLDAALASRRNDSLKLRVSKQF